MFSICAVDVSKYEECHGYAVGGVRRRETILEMVRAYDQSGQGRRKGTGSTYKIFDERREINAGSKHEYETSSEIMIAEEKQNGECNHEESMCAQARCVEEIDVQPRMPETSLQSCEDRTFMLDSLENDITDG